MNSCLDHTPTCMVLSIQIIRPTQLVVPFIIRFHGRVFSICQEEHLPMKESSLVEMQVDEKGSRKYTKGPRFDGENGDKRCEGERHNAGTVGRGPQRFLNSRSRSDQLNTSIRSRACSHEIQAKENAPVCRLLHSSPRSRPDVWQNSEKKGLAEQQCSYPDKYRIRQDLAQYSRDIARPRQRGVVTAFGKRWA
jgi:hypothetical protein